MRRIVLSVALVGIAVAGVSIALVTGSVSLTPTEVWQALLGNGSDVNRQIVQELRAPRVFAAFACGGLLAIAGTLLQVLLRNPLADPYILGISGGASVAALCALSLGMPALGTNLGALLGAVLAILLIAGVSVRGGWSTDRVLLAGVVLSAGFSAIVSLFLIIAPAAQLHGMLFWLMGDLSRVISATPVLIVFIIVVVLAVLLGHLLDVLSLGEIKAASLGLNAKFAQYIVFILAAVATTAVVVAAGPIGFVGLLTPHVIRLLGVTQNRALIALSAIAGGGFLVWADLVARSTVAPLQLPVGAVTALLGVPLLFFLLVRR
ncbi:MAG: iron ABC transporter permease [Burkholderiales bacterium]